MKTALALLLFLSLNLYNFAQTGTSFENLTAQTFSSPNCLYNDPDNTTAHTLQNFNAMCGEIVVQAAPTPTELGFEIVWSPTGGNAGTGFSDDDAFGVATSASLATETGAAAPDGEQGFLMEDTDGEVTMTFTAVDLSGTGSPQVSLQYILAATSWEIEDYLYAYVNISGASCATTTVDIVDTRGMDIDGNLTEGSWVTATADLSAFSGCLAQLVIEHSSNAASEELGIDNINFSEGAVLPVELTTFRVKNQKAGIELYWETASEYENDYFLVEKSEDAIHFETIGKVQGAGTTLVPQKYIFVDDASYSELTTYYRLKQVDFDGSFEYSSIISTKTKENANFKSYPNPIKDLLYIEVADASPFYLTIHNE
ncbi:MAG: hypothetical protein AAF599_19895, partial [Bacteroidota bacterium]